MLDSFPDIKRCFIEGGLKSEIIEKLNDIDNRLTVTMVTKDKSDMEILIKQFDNSKKKKLVDLLTDYFLDIEYKIGEVNKEVEEIIFEEEAEYDL